MRAWMIGLVALLASPAEAQIKAPLTITDADYPRYALANGLTGRTIMVIDIRDDGTVAACAIARSSGHGLLDDQSCALYMARAKFDPVPVKRRVQAPVSWENGDRPVPDPRHLLQGFAVDYPHIKLGERYSEADLAMGFPICETKDGRMVCAADARSAPWLGKGNTEALGLVVDTTSGTLVNLTILLPKSRQGRVARLLEERLGKPCFIAEKIKVWINGSTYVALADGAVAIVQRGSFDSSNYDQACKPPPL